MANISHLVLGLTLTAHADGRRVDACSFPLDATRKRPPRRAPSPARPQQVRLRLFSRSLASSASPSLSFYLSLCLPRCLAYPPSPLRHTHRELASYYLAVPYPPTCPEPRGRPPKAHTVSECAANTRPFAHHVGRATSIPPITRWLPPLLPSYAAPFSSSAPVADRCPLPRPPTSLFPDRPPSAYAPRSRTHPSTLLPRPGFCWFPVWSSRCPSALTTAHKT